MRITDQYRPGHSTVAEATSICLQSRNPDGVLAAPEDQDHLGSHLPSTPLNSAAAEEMGGNSLKVCQGGFRLDIGDNFSLERAQTAQGSCGVLEEFESHGDVTFGDKGWVVAPRAGGIVGLDALKDLFQPE